MPGFDRLAAVVLAFLMLSAARAADAPPASAPADTGVLPTGEDGKPINTDFETGTLRDWTITSGNAFTGQPIKGDTINTRRSDMHSRHVGSFWIGTYEISRDGPRGTMQSKPFIVNKPWAKFLVGGGGTDESVDIVLADDNKLFFHASGENVEDMQAVAVDLRPIMGKKIYLRLIDDHSFGWGHLNFDDFKLYDKEPVVPKRVVLTPDAVKFAGLTPDQAVKAMTLPPGFKATLFAGEPDVHQPIGFTLDDRGRLWVAEAYTYPVRAPEGQGKDDILIFEDTDGDGHFDKRTVFTTGLNLVSGIEVGFGGVWVGAAPYMMFIPDKNHDDKPDGPPQILLDGFAYPDTHETLNAFTWGPDGWLYGCHGVFTHSLVGKPGTPKKDRIPINAGVWRYHPTRHVFEVFAEGTSNPWGIDWNDQGQAFITACVIPHLYHVFEGGHYQRQAGSHFNPYVYDDIKTIADHVHWLGDAGPHAGNDKSGSAGGGHAHCGAMIYLGNNWPDEYRNSIYMGNIHGNRMNHDNLVPSGSGYIGTHSPDPVLMNDKWSRLINFKYGPDGSVYFLDWYDKQACHNPVGEIWDRTNGRIYRLSYGDPKPVTVDLNKASDELLVKQTLHKNDWYVRHARRLLQERAPGQKVAASLRQIMNNPDATRRLRALWAMDAAGALQPDDLHRAIKDADPHVRAWAIQLAVTPLGPSVLTTLDAAPLAPSHQGDSEFISTAAELAKSDPSPVVRLAIASAMQRLAPGDRWPVLQNLVAHAEDVADHNLPLMDWYAAEPSVGQDIDRGLALAKSSKIPLLQDFIARRVCAVAVADAAGDVSKVNPAPLAALAKLLAGTTDAALQREVLNGMTEGLRGWPRLPTPAGWAAVYDKLAGAGDDAIKNRVQALSVVFGEERAMASLRQTIADPQADLGERHKAIDALVGAKDPKLPSLLQKLVAEPAIRPAAIRGLAGFDDPKTPAIILRAYPTLDTQTKIDALNTLASRAEYALQIKAAIESKTLQKSDITAATLRQLASLDNDAIQKWVTDSFGTVRSTPNQKLREINRWKERLERKNWADSADAWHGRAVFAKTCMQCHTLFNVGGKVGPDLTGSNRADVSYILSNVVDPSAVIGKDYLVSIIKTTDKRVISGIVKADDGNALTVQTESQVLTIPRSEVTFQKQQSISMMPEGLLAGLQYNEVRDLVAYLGSQRQVPILATPANAATFFNGKDLSNWNGDQKLWHVENGEIIGKTDGLKKNEFLFSQMAAADFRLTFQIKLVNNQGNSGMQFRTEALPDGEAKGYQADVGPGWWGKLYEENGRTLLWKQSGEQYVKPGEWNSYEIVAVGDTIRTALNGHPCVDLNDPAGAKRGIFGIQLHAGGPTEVHVKDLKLEVDPKAELSSVKP